MAYIERRPEAIKAIKKAISGKWDKICMGCVTVEPRCSLCDIYYDLGKCRKCPLYKSRNKCTQSGSAYDDWSGHGQVRCEDCAGCDVFDDCPVAPAPAEAEAMLEALVMLLPPKHRKEYGG